ncbi:hypothetical protein FLA_0925 [Filimonas lacunae]|nr:hypothetical protein FLA_0925 [Filimonas lacunae]
MLTRIHDVTPAEVKALPTFQYYSDEQVVQLISTIKTFTQIGYSMFYEKQQEEEAKVFNLSDNSPKQNVA